MLVRNPVKGEIHKDPWSRPTGNIDFKMTQDFGPTSLAAEPAVSWPGGEDIPKGYYPDFHRGIDLGNKRCGDPVLAAASGTVLAAGVYSDGATYCIIDHGGGWRTWYWHLATGSLKVSKGSKVTVGQQIGTVGNTGNSTACHLHFGIKQNATSVWDGQYVDPWRRLIQNVTIYIAGTAGVNLRATAGKIGTTELGLAVAQLKSDGLIHRLSDGVSLGVASQPRKYDGRVQGGSYVVNGTPGDTWDKIWLDSKWLYVATPFARISQL